MSLRGAVLQGVQVGIETTPGTAVACSKQMLCTRVMPKASPKVKAYRGVGSRYNVGVVQAKEMDELRISGEVIGYDDIAYLLAIGLKGGVTGSPFTFNPAAFAAESVKTATFQYGDATRAEQVAFAFLSELRMRFTDAEATLSGRGYAQTQTEGVTLTATPTKLSKDAVNPKSVTVLVGNSVAGLAAITRPLVAEFGFSNWRRPSFFLNSDPSFSDAVEAAPDVTATLVTEYGSVAAGYMADLAASTQKFLRILATDGAKSLQITLPFFFLDSDSGDQEDIYTNTFHLGVDYESTLGGVEIVVTNGLVGL